MKDVTTTIMNLAALMDGFKGQSSLRLRCFAEFITSIRHNEPKLDAERIDWDNAAVVMIDTEGGKDFEFELRDGNKTWRKMSGVSAHGLMEQWHICADCEGNGGFGEDMLPGDRHDDPVCPECQEKREEEAHDHAREMQAYRSL